MNLFATKDTYTKTGADPLLTVFDANMIEKNVDQNTNEHLLSPAPNARVNAPNNGPGLPIHVGDANGPFTIFDVNENEIDADENNTIPLLTLAPDAEVNAPNNGPGLSILFGDTKASAIGSVIHAVNALCDPLNDQVCPFTLEFPPNTKASTITSRNNSATPKATAWKCGAVKAATAPEGVVGIAAAGKNVFMGMVRQNLLDLAK